MLFAMLDQEDTSCNRPFGVRANYTMAPWHSFFRPKVPRLEERVPDDGNSEKMSEKQVSTRELGHTGNFSRRATFARVSI